MEVFKIGACLFKTRLQISRTYEQNKLCAEISSLADLKQHHLELINIPLQNPSCIASAGWLQGHVARGLPTENDQLWGVLVGSVGGRKSSEKR